MELLFKNIQVCTSARYERLVLGTDCVYRKESKVKWSSTNRISYFFILAGSFEFGPKWVMSFVIVIMFQNSQYFVTS